MGSSTILRFHHRPHQIRAILIFGVKYSNLPGRAYKGTGCARTLWRCWFILNFPPWRKFGTLFYLPFMRKGVFLCSSTMRDRSAEETFDLLICLSVWPSQRFHFKTFILIQFLVSYFHFRCNVFRSSHFVNKAEQDNVKSGPDSIVLLKPNPVSLLRYVGKIHNNSEDQINSFLLSTFRKRTSKSKRFILSQKENT